MSDGAVCIVARVGRCGTRCRRLGRARFAIASDVRPTLDPGSLGGAGSSLNTDRGVLVDVTLVIDTATVEVTAGPPGAASANGIWPVDVGDSVADAVQAVQECTGLTLAEARSLVDTAPVQIAPAPWIPREVCLASLDRLGVTYELLPV